MNNFILFSFLMFLLPYSAVAQQFPGEDENIPYLITFGNSGSTSWGDDDFSQTFFLSVPPSQKEPFYVRVFDPDVGGELLVGLGGLLHEPLGLLQLLVQLGDGVDLGLDDGLRVLLLAVLAPSQVDSSSTPNL